MRLSQFIGERLKEKPAEANLISHIYLLKGGYIRYVGNGIYTLMPAGKRIVKKIENIIREEMDRIDGQEVSFPVVIPASLWQESGRFDTVGPELLRFVDRSGIPHVLGMTHEEPAVLLAKTDAQTYTKYPFMVYQIQTKFRDEARCRGGLMRTREFTMKDAYSYHRNQEDLEKYYDRCHEAYMRIYQRTGIPQVVSVASDSGMIGGDVSHEFMLLCSAGEDTIAICDKCGYRANLEAAHTVFVHNETEEKAIEEVHTPEVKTIADLVEFTGIPATRSMKATVFTAEGDEKPIIAFVRGDYEVSEAKLHINIGDHIAPFSDDETELHMGSLGAIGLDPEKYTIIFDESLRGERDLVCGANKDGYHLKGVSMPRDLSEAEFMDISKVREGDPCPECDSQVHLKAGVEVGNIFQLGTTYSESMNLTYTEEDGKQKSPIMGCYGIGVGRLMASVVEARNDEYGPIWPYAIAPWQVHICALDNKKAGVLDFAENLYADLSKDYEVMFDDRDAQAGIAFADADLLGIPVRIIVSPKSMKAGEVEIVTRNGAIKKRVKQADIKEELKNIVAEIKESENFLKD